MCKQKPDWFIAASNGQLDYVRANMAKFLGRTDKRETNEPQIVFSGFGAIHYACFMDCVDVVKLLLPYEFDLQTRETVLFSAPGFSPCTKYKLASGSLCLAISLLRGNSRTSQAILEYIDQNTNAQDNLGVLNSMGLSTYIIAGLCKGPEAYSVINSRVFIQRELPLVVTGDITPIFNAAYFGRPELAKALERISQDDEFREIIYEMALKRDNGNQTAIDLAIMDVDLIKFDCTQEEREQVQAIIYDLVKSAFVYAQAKANAGDSHWENVVNGFLAGKQPIQVFGEVL